MGKGALWFNVFLKEGSVRVGKGVTILLRVV